MTDTAQDSTVEPDSTFESPDTTTNFGDAAAANECPGGAGCPCAANDECDTAFCIETNDGKQCARHCVDTCADGYSCTPITGPGGDPVTICVPKWSRLCNPCTTSKECAALGLDTSACIDQGANGAFCGTQCVSDLSCPEGYACSNVKTVEGADAKLCSKKPAVSDPGPYGECDCNLRAATQKLTTTCSVEKLDKDKKLVCSGIRSCGADGLGACTGADPAKEACDGEDNDCDGEVDEGSCDDGNACTSEVCAGDKGCVENDLNGVPCSDGNACTTTDSCKTGVCVPGAPKQCDDNNPCTKDTCEMATGCTQTADDFKPCTDDNPCTLGDTCKGQVCKSGKDKECSIANPCQTALCNLVDGKCAFANATTGKSCDDSDACTKNDGCDGAVCLGKKVTCDDNNACTDDYCDGKTGCDAKNNSAPCEDGNVCTLADKCNGGGCKPGSIKACDDGNPCTADTCDPKAGGCKGDGGPLDGKPCDADKNACTTGDSCKAGKCTVGSAKKCDDANACTENGCDKEKGCTAKPKYSGACDADGTLCTVSDSCKAGICTAGAKKVCDDGNACSTGTCDANNGKCVFLAKANNSACGPNGAKCKFAQCVAGCVPKVSKKCHNDDVFWFDSCGTATDVFLKCTDDEFCAAAACKKGQFSGNYHITANPSTQNIVGVGAAKFVPLTLTVTDWGNNKLQGDFTLSGKKYSFTGNRVAKKWTASVVFTDSSGTLAITHNMSMNVTFKVDSKKTSKPLPDLMEGNIVDKLTFSGFGLGSVLWNITGKKL